MVEIPSKIGEWNNNIWVVEDKSMVKINESKKRLNFLGLTNPK